MAMPEPTGGPVSSPELEPLAAGAFVPDAAVIERLANAFFQGLTGGAPVSSPAVPASAPWSAPGTGSVPVQPPLGQPEPPTSGIPSSIPYRLFGGASASSASPFAFVQSRAGARDEPNGERGAARRSAAGG
jgi:hypothetical protein